MFRKSLLVIVLLSLLLPSWCQRPVQISQKSHYRIVIPNDPTEVEATAAKELQDILQNIFQTSFPIVNEKSYKGRHAISVGRTQMAASLYKQYQDSIHDDGFLLHTDGKKLYIIGLREKSVLYGAYHLLEHHLGCRMPVPNDLNYPILQQKKLSLHDLQNPSFSYREVLQQFPNTDQRYADWHKLHNRAYFNEHWGLFVHTFQRLIPADGYFDVHPEWFSMIQGQRVRDGQLCLSNPEVLEELCANLAVLMEASPEKETWSVSQNDNENSCTCPNCLHLDSLYGGKSGTMVWFVNQVARRFPDKTISTLAYLQTRRPPRNIRPEPNVNIMFCSIECHRERPIADNPADQSFMRDMEGWHALTDNIFLWDYVVQFKNFLDPFPNLHVLQPNLQNFHDHGIQMVFEQGSNRHHSESCEWRTFLLAHLLWDVNLNVDSLRDRFLDIYYGPNRAPFIKQYYDTMQAALLASGQFLNIYGFPIDAKEGYLAPDKIAFYQSLFQQAYAVPPYDYLRGLHYSLYDDRLRLLELSLDFAIQDLAFYDLSPELSYFKKLPDGTLDVNEEMMTRARRFMEDCKRLNITHLDESTFAADLLWLNIRNYLRKSSLRGRPNKAIGKPVQCLTTWSHLYDVGGPRALTDGILGAPDYRTRWLGFQGEDMDVIIDLGEETDIYEVSADFYYYPLSWIFAPVNMVCYISDDLTQWKEVDRKSFENGTNLTESRIKTFQCLFMEEKGRYVRVRAESLKTNPAWHRGYGQPCWIFCDEIIVR
ncbi:MAG: DUF4838 domain-containing protein [Bacteroidales bacterium]|nr:DUF4838 domain-containing protein [Bacteroidales bacterium]